MRFLMILCVLAMSSLSMANEREIPKADDIVTKYADLGDPQAQFVLARMYADGRGVPQSDDLAIMWYERSARGGFTEAQHRMGTNHLKGRFGLIEDPGEAFSWYILAAEREHKVSQYYVGNLLLKGEGVEQDVVEGLNWLERAAGNNCKRAKARLGQVYELGVGGIPVDNAIAVEWYLQAAKHDMSFAQRALGRLYRNGKGVEKNATEAAKWYRLAAEKGKVDAQLALAEMLESGEGDLAPNQTEASYWRQRANNRGFAPGKLH